MVLNNAFTANAYFPQQLIALKSVLSNCLCLQQSIPAAIFQALLLFLSVNSDIISDLVLFLIGGIFNNGKNIIDFSSQFRKEK